MNNEDWPLLSPGRCAQSDFVDPAAASTGQRNKLGEFLLGHHIAEGLAGSSAETSLNPHEVLARVLRLVSYFWHVFQITTVKAPYCNLLEALNR